MSFVYAQDNYLNMGDTEDTSKTRDGRGRFLPGQRPVGRGKGKQNKVTEEVREKFQQLMDSYSIHQMKADLMELEAADRLKIISGLLDFFIPKLNRTDHSMTLGDETIIIQLPGSSVPQLPVYPNELEDTPPDPLREGELK